MDKVFWMVWNPNGSAPRHQHPDIQSAFNEAERLARLNSGQQFIVLQAIGLRQLDSMRRVTFKAPEDCDIPFLSGENPNRHRVTRNRKTPLKFAPCGAAKRLHGQADRVFCPQRFVISRSPVRFRPTAPLCKSTDYCLGRRCEFFRGW